MTPKKLSRGVDEENQTKVIRPSKKCKSRRKKQQKGGSATQDGEGRGLQYTKFTKAMGRFYDMKEKGTLSKRTE